MIRRSPTLIPMSDLDVQDIRNLVEYEQQQSSAISDQPEKQPQDNAEMSDSARAAQAKQERARRLGLAAGPSFQNSQSTSRYNYFNFYS